MRTSILSLSARSRTGGGFVLSDSTQSREKELPSASSLDRRGVSRVLGKGLNDADFRFIVSFRLTC
jgi:hypothetical protein